MPRLRSPAGDALFFVNKQAGENGWPRMNTDGTKQQISVFICVHLWPLSFSASRKTIPIEALDVYERANAINKT
jgi:hypothetical protein